MQNLALFFVLCTTVLGVPAFKNTVSPVTAATATVSATVASSSVSNLLRDDKKEFTVPVRFDNSGIQVAADVGVAVHKESDNHPKEKSLHDGVIASHGDKALSLEELMKGMRLLEERIQEEANKIRIPEERPYHLEPRFRELLKVAMSYLELKEKKEVDEGMARLLESLRPFIEYMKKMGTVGEKLSNSTTSM